MIREGEENISSRAHQRNTTNDSDVFLEIKVLPQSVVDRIAAGEVVQRPANAVKELLENCIDAKSNKIQLTVDKRSLDFTISDNGCGIRKNDLALAAKRFATSKLKTTHDFDSLSSFGFRGEALASVSMVSRLAITSRKKGSKLAYMMSYQDGKPTTTTTTNKCTTEIAPKSCARQIGTTIKVQDVFHNVPLRQKTMLKNANDEYNRILSVLQCYAIQYASREIAIICQGIHSGRKGKAGQRGAVTDLNTTSYIQKNVIGNTTTNKDLATENVIASIYGSELKPHLIQFKSNIQLLSQNDKNNEGKLKKEIDNSKYSREEAGKEECRYTCTGYLTSSSYYYMSSTAATKTSIHNNGKNMRKTAKTRTSSLSSFVLFINDRNVECFQLKRSIDQCYKHLTGGFKSPFVYLSIHVPPTHIDVNVHPTKQQVTLLHSDEIINHIAEQIMNQFKQLESEQGHIFSQNVALSTESKTAFTQKIASPTSKNTSGTKTAHIVTPNVNTKKRASISLNNTNRGFDEHVHEEDKNESIKKRQKSLANTDTNNDSSKDGYGKKQPKNPRRTEIVRVNSTKTGALEPFLVFKSSQSLSQTSQLNSQSPATMTKSQNGDNRALHDENGIYGPLRRIHPNPDCPVGKREREKEDDNDDSVNEVIDMSQPGAFAKILICICPKPIKSNPLSQQENRPRIFPIPKRIIPMACSFSSIKRLRKKVQKNVCSITHDKLRSSIFVGTLSEQNCLIQSGQNLILFNYQHAAQELFYQCAVAQFDGGTKTKMATFPDIDVETIVGQYLQYEEKINSVKTENNSCDPTDEQDDHSYLIEVNETNHILTRQVTECLLEKAPMLHEYFKIKFVEQPNNSQKEDGSNCSEDDDVGNKFCSSNNNSSSNRLVLAGLPILLPGNVPNPSGLPLFLLRLATKVDWSTEEACFDGICRELGYYYSQMTTIATDNDYSFTVQHFLFPAISRLLIPPKQQNEGDELGHSRPYFQQMTKLSRLYKVFERC